MVIIKRPAPEQPAPGQPMPPRPDQPLTARVTASVSEGLKGALKAEAAERDVSEAQVLRECLRVRYADKGVYEE